MKKLGRFLLLALCYMVLFICFYSAIPFIAWVFGASFQDVAQSVPYSVIATVVIATGLGALFSHCFDNDFYAKH
jgi:hypothetical protein